MNDEHFYYRNCAQSVWHNPESTQSDKESCKVHLDRISESLVEGSKVGDVILLDEVYCLVTEF